jgi:hypothetical protein
MGQRVYSMRQEKDLIDLSNLWHIYIYISYGEQFLRNVILFYLTFMSSRDQCGPILNLPIMFWYEIWGFHSSEDLYCDLMGYDSM